MPLGGKAVPRSTIAKIPASQMSNPIAQRSPCIQKPSAPVGKVDRGFLRPLSRSVPRANAALFKSSSCQDIKSSRSNSHSSVDSRDSSKSKKFNNISGRKPTSAVALPTAVLRESNSLKKSGTGTANGDRMWVNCDLLARVDKEKKHFEMRISELTQIAEARKSEIEKLSLEIRNLREVKFQVQSDAQCQGSDLSGSATKNAVGGDSTGDSSFSGPLCSYALPDSSVDTKTSILPCVSMLDKTNAMFADQKFMASSISNLDCDEILYPTSVMPHVIPLSPSVTNLEDRIHEMEEANYTTTEELQATMGELCDLQRTLDEAQEDNRNLTFDRAVLVESVCTQAAKLEHCRLQIEQLKHLLVTNPVASKPDSREAHYVELYSLVEDEKRFLLSQNNFLEQCCKTLDTECQDLTDKLEKQTREFKRLQAKVEVPGSVISSANSPFSSTYVNQVAIWKEKFELEKSEREREANEWQLYEKDLLKAVEVADKIKMDGETEVAWLALESHELMDQVKRLSAELDDAYNETARLREELSKASILKDIPIAALPSQHMTLLPLEMKSVATMTSFPEDSNTSSPSAQVSFNSSNPILNPYQRLHRSAYLQKLGFTPTNTTASPGGPSSIRRSGPTVQSLIQSIENQGKTVQQHQQKASTHSRTPSTSTSASPTASKAIPEVLSATRRIHSAGSSPSSTPLHHGLRNILDEDIMDDSAPGGPPPQSSLSAPTQTTSSLRIKPIFSSSSDDTVRPKSPSISSSQVSAIDSFHIAFTPLGAASPSTAFSSLPTPRLKRHPTAPASSTGYSGGTSICTNNNNTANSVISETSSNVLAGASAALAPSGAPTRITDVSPTRECTGASANVTVVSGLDPLQDLAKRTNAGSKRNALLRWCQGRIAGYRGVEVTNFSSSWNDGLALCALLHTYMPSKIAPSWERVVNKMDRQKRFEVAFSAAESRGIPTTLRLHDMLTKDRPDWSSVMSYIATIYKHFEAS